MRTTALFYPGVVQQLLRLFSVVAVATLFGTLSLLLVPVQGSQDADVRIVTPAELQTANGVVDPNRIWLSIGGKVYDVSVGKTYYGPGGPYHAFAGRDAPVPFVTGIFTDEEAAKSWRDLTPSQLSSLHHWISFYDTHFEKNRKYPLVGHLQGTFYHADGTPTEERKEMLAAVEAAIAPKDRSKTEL